MKWKIVWEYWLAAVNWDRNVNSRPIHYKVASEHLQPDGPQKMRNHLAEDILNDMSTLMQALQRGVRIPRCDS